MILAMTKPKPKTAPALVVLAHGSRDPRSALTIHEIVAKICALRPQLHIEAAFLDLCDPLFGDCVTELVRAGYDAVVVVPLLLTAAFHAGTDVPQAIAVAAQRHPGLGISASPILGLDRSSFAVLDRRLDEALCGAGASAAAALVLAAAGSSNPAANRAVANFAQQWGDSHNIPAVAAYAAGTAPTTGAAIRELQSKGHRNIAVGSLFVAPGRLHDRAAKLALEAGAIAVASPMGATVEVAGAILDRYDETSG